MNVGILGGTFDPIHIGHLIVAEEARIVLQLDKVVFIPAGDPWMKANRNITDASRRKEMVKLAIELNKYFCLSTIEIENPGWTYTVDTLEKLVKAYQSRTNLFLLIGWDGLNNMPVWKDPNRIFKMATIVTFPRLGVTKPDLQLLESMMPSLSDSIVMLEKPLIDISSTEIRERVANGKSIRYRVTKEVENYIYEQGLYKNAQSIPQYSGMGNE